MTKLALETTRQERPKKKKAVAAVLEKEPAAPGASLDTEGWLKSCGAIGGKPCGSRGAMLFDISERTQLMKKTAQRQPLRTKAPPQKRSRQKVVTINAEIVKLQRHGAGHTSYNEALASEILDQLAEGKTMRAICREPGMPSARTVNRWATDDVNGFADRYERARKLQADAIFDETLDISNEEFIDSVEVQAARLKVDTRKWFLSKLYPEKFGDKIEVTSRTERLSDEQVDAQLLNLLETADHASLLKPPGTRKLLAKPRR